MFYKASNADYANVRNELLEEKKAFFGRESESLSKSSLFLSSDQTTRIAIHHSPQNPRTWLRFLLVSIFILFLFAFLFLTTYALFDDPKKIESHVLYHHGAAHDELSTKMQNLVDAGNIKEHLKFLAQGIHIAGTQDNNFVMSWVAEKYRELNLPVRLHTYEVLLNYPDFEQPNTIELLDNNTGFWTTISYGRATAVGGEKILKQQLDSRGTHWWNAYSANGTVASNVVYVNYGFKEDYDFLALNAISINGSIALIRLGGISRSEKVRYAEDAGAIGVILFNDPLHYSSLDNLNNFPNDIFLPGTDAQRGTLLNTVGDPETPGLPSVEYVHRFQSIEEARKKRFMPQIPVFPISYDDAALIMNALDGIQIREPSWRGGLEAVYRYTGTRKFKLTVRSFFTRKTITNIIATLQGLTEPDKWVMLGNHVDAWTYGAIDPLTGTATQLEIARVLSLLQKPKRTIVFSHWDGEEFGLLGSSEYVEEMQHILQNRVIAYLNIDHIAGNVTLGARGVPLLERLLAESAMKIPQTNMAESKAGRNTLFASWNYHKGKQGVSQKDRYFPSIGLPKVGSDYQRFISFIGVPVLDLRMENVPMQSYPLYHTMYEIPHLVDMMDPIGNTMATMGKLWADISLRLANDFIVPLNVRDYGRYLTSAWKKTFLFLLKQENINEYFLLKKAMLSLEDAIAHLNKGADIFQNVIDSVTREVRGLTAVQQSQINSRLQHFEQCFIQSLSFTDLHRHIIFSPVIPFSKSVKNMPSGGISAIMNPLIKFIQADDDSQRNDCAEELLFAINRVQYAISAATNLLELDASILSPNSE